MSRALFLRFVGDSGASRLDDLRDDGRTNAPILLFNPSTGVYFSKRGAQPTWAPCFAGYGGTHRDTGRFSLGDLGRTVDGFFLKASYLFRM